MAMKKLKGMGGTQGGVGLRYRRQF